VSGASKRAPRGGAGAASAPRHPRARLQQAGEALGATLGFARPAELVLELFYKSHRGMGARDRRECAAIVYGALRHLRRLERALAAAGIGARDGATLAGAWCALEGGWGAADLAAASWPHDAARLIAAAPDPATLKFAERWSLPDWLAERIAAQYGIESDALAAALLEQAPVDLRANTLKVSREALAARLAAHGLEAVPIADAPEGLRLAGRAALRSLPEFKQGQFELQDAGSQRLGALLEARPGERVLDLCAGAGGKSLQLAAAMGDRGTVWACDVDAARLARLAPRAARAGATCIATRVLDGLDDPWLAAQRGGFDAVLVDAPCSGSGTLRRHPDLKWRPCDLAGLVETQQRLLAAALALARPGGRVVYGSCSLLAEEGAAVVAACGLPPVASLALAPHRDACDGFYAARIAVA
jgi:16S rRNA (cytosine967-C5)-methyltransferase